MGIIFLIPILVCGFYYLTIGHLHRYKIKKVEGQQLYFKSAMYGFIFTAIGFFLSSYLIVNSIQILDYEFTLKNIQKWVNTTIFSAINSVEFREDILLRSAVLQDSFRKIGFYTTFALTFILSVMITYVYALIVEFTYLLKEILKDLANKIWRFFLNFDRLKKIIKNRRVQIVRAFLISIWQYLPIVDVISRWNNGLLRIKKEIKNPLDSLLYESVEYHQNDYKKGTHSRLIMLTMSDRKVYIGMVVGFGKESDRYSVDSDTFFFVPFKSGYRNKYDLRVCVTTDYSDVIKRIKKLNEIELVLNKTTIVSACHFDEDRFKSFDKSPQLLKFC